MALINWNDSYSVKVAKIDLQHKGLVALINELHEAMCQGKGKDVLAEILDKLIAYAVVHFGTEEKYFVQYGYPKTTTHKLEHADFAQKVSAFKTKFDDGAAMLSVEIMNFLKDWLVEHMQGTDQKYSSFFNEKGLR